MLTKRDWISFFVGVAIATVLLAYSIQRTNVVQHHVCESNVRVREPLEAYISSTIPLLRLSETIQRKEAALASPIHTPSPELVKLQDELAALQRTNFQHLLTLRSALRQAVAAGCPN